VEHLQAIIFDVDGTLADTENIHRIAFNMAFNKHGLDWQWSKKEYTRLLSVSGGFERMKCYSREPRGIANRTYSDKLIKTIHRTKSDIYAQLLLSSNIKLRPGIGRLIAEARRDDIQLAIATNTNQENVEILLSKNLPEDWKSWFTTIETSNTVMAKKPSPAIYLEILKKIRVEPSHAVALEDTENGLSAAKAAGIGAVITTHQFTRHSKFPEALLVVDSAGSPSSPFKILNGKAIEERWLTVAVLDKLLNQKSST
jgi:HAD superfamily hydrolase (TIGR01509 family)